VAFFQGTVFKAKTAEVLENYYGYRHRDMQPMIRSQFNAVCDMIQKRGENEYDAATFFMLSLRSQLSDDPKWDEIKMKWLSAAKETARFAQSEETVSLVVREAGLQ